MFSSIITQPKTLVVSMFNAAFCPLASMVMMPLRHDGMTTVIAVLQSSGKFFVKLDDPSVMPGTFALALSGLMWWHIVELFEASAAKGQILRLSLVELTPKNDLSQILMIGAGRLILKLIMFQFLKSR